MKKGFALLETIIVITFLAVSLLLLYKTFAGIVTDTKQNILYDDITNIYKAYYTKEYLSKYGLLDKISDSKIEEITCNDFNDSGCDKLIKTFNISKMYITKSDLKEYDASKYSSSFNNYLSTLSNNIKETNRLVLEFEDDNVINYASIGINGDTYE